MAKKNKKKEIEPYDFEKEISGTLYVTMTIPFKVKIPARMEVYEDEDGTLSYEEDYDYSPDDIITRMPGNSYECIRKCEELGWTVEDTGIE